MIEITSLIMGGTIGWTLGKVSSILSVIMREDKLRNEWRKDMQITMSQLVPQMMQNTSAQQGQENAEQQISKSDLPKEQAMYIG